MEPATAEPATDEPAAGHEPVTDKVTEQMLAQMRERLDLTEEQLEAAAPILGAANEASRGVLERHGMSFPPAGPPESGIGFLEARRLRQELEAIETKSLTQLQDVLSEQQLETYRGLLQERREALRDRIREDR